MNDNSDRSILLVAVLTAIMLLMVFIGESIPIVIRTIVYGISIVGIMGVLMLRNILTNARTAVIRKLYLGGILAFAGIIVSLILFDNSFVSGDTLRFGMEPATAMLVFGVALFPFYFVLLWVVSFERAIVTPEKEMHLNRIKEEGKEQSDG